MYSVILSRGRWHTHTQCQSDPLDWDDGGGEFSRGRQPPRQDQQVWLTNGSISSMEADGPFTFFFQATPRPRNDFQHRGGHWTQLKTRIRISPGSHVTVLFPLPSYTNTHQIDSASFLHTFTLLFSGVERCSFHSRQKRRWSPGGHLPSSCAN